MSGVAVRELRQYLLGELPNPERERIETEVIRDRSVLHEVEDVEDELIEDYLSGAMPNDARARFEQHFLNSTEHRRSLDAARLLRELLPPVDTLGAGVARTPRPVLVWVGLAASVAFAAIAAGTWWLGIPRPATPVAEQPAPVLAPAVSVPEASRPVAPPVPAPPPKLATLVLAPGLQMDASQGMPRVRLAPDVKRLKLELIVEDPELGRCRASVTSAEHGELWKADGLRPQRSAAGTTLSLEIPVERLPPASSYKVTLFTLPALTRSGSYHFQVTRTPSR
jgi:hypothetical protein